MAVTNEAENTATVLLGRGDGTFTASAVDPRTGTGPNYIAVGDFNGDGIPDLAVTNAGDNTATALLGNGDGTFTALVPVATGSRPSSLVVGDFNGDGISDLAVTNAGDNTVKVLLGHGDGTFTATAVSPQTDIGPSSVAVGDFNADGISDLVVASCCNYAYGPGKLAILSGDGTAALRLWQVSRPTMALNSSRLRTLMVTGFRI